MKKALSLLFIALGILLSAACENEPHQVVSYITSPEVAAKISQGLQGDYSGKLLVIMDDTTSHIMHNEAGTWERRAYRDSVRNFKYSVTPLNVNSSPATAHITLSNFPICWLSRAVSNAELRTALKDYPNVPLELELTLHGEMYNPDSHEGYLRVNPLPLELDITLAGTSHKLTIEFDKCTHYTINADDSSSWPIAQVQMEVAKLLIDDELLEEFDVAWTTTPSPEFLIHLRGEKVI